MISSPDKALIKSIDKNKKEQLLKLATNASVVVALILVVIKAIAWAKTGSVAMLGSLLDSVLDAAAAFINMYFIRSAMQPADAEHRFGHGKAEPIGGMFQAMIIGGSAVFLMAESVRRLINPEFPVNTELGISIMLVSSAMVAVLVLIQRYVVKRTGSVIVAGDALHGFGDIAINLGVILALVLSGLLNSPLIDPVIAIVLACVLIRGAWSIGKNAIEQLMDTEFSEEEREHIRTLAKQHARVNDIHDLRTRRAGLSAFIQFHLEMDGEMNLNQAHAIADEIEQLIQQEFPNTEVLIHQDPQGIEEVDPFLRS
ncbi:MAG: cation diffusion facilitator family transporter [Oceanicoccus sp.]|uniref:cation diffusion facilitator family transporter n=1 Tax=Oceanicoccus sp. TaxID=2691044 RepID=UPI00260A51A4|nr:cation diffusion facilitator family transporter [Oceanicoccus sp.]MCP3908509.1 cation diffusion facilitator family transporter [Oceanicoccus sp.]MDG1773199.1 cation diffusion facilitator family transporter [Oceanicoccus sp.]